MDFSAMLHRFTVIPSLTPELVRLQKISANLWWTWEPEARALFKRIDLELWHAVRHNPVEMLGTLQQATLDSLAADEGFMVELERVYDKLQAYLSGTTWFERTYGKDHNIAVAYFSMEFGFHESLPIYSGGLGILSGDHLKSASDQGIPLVAVGLLYRQGYFRQYLNIEGWQQEIYPENDFYNMPLQLERDNDRVPLSIELDFPGRKLKAHIWRVQVGRVRLFLLDTNLEENSPEDREITAQLYGGDKEMRIRQEILLGIGGIRALRLLGIKPNVCHMNEGHSAFMGLERTRLLMAEQGVSFREAIEIVRAGTVFTTHTPVEAGIDHFAPDLLEKYIGKYYRALGLSRDEFLGLGRQNPLNSHESFCMAVLALKLAAHSNGVSELHGDVSRQMWKNLWPELPEEHLPLSSITNGVHPKTWLSQDMSGLLTRYLGSRWQDEPTNQAVWRRVSRIPDAEIWRIHERCRERLVGFARERLKAQLAQVGATPKEIESAEEVLDPETLTIGFARRFATYKRGTLLLRDPERLARILNNPDRPVQIIFAGKAHPHDNEGKELIRQIVQFSKGESFRNRIVFIDDYDMSVARHLVQGVDVWLNTPRRPLEASGTSGMKVAFNGGLNMSVLDGWWCEGYRGNNGWAIGKGEVYSDLEFQNEVEGRAIYDLLEKEVVPLFYDRGSDSIPRSWISWMKNSMMSLCPFFSTDRMVQEYTDRFYIHAYDHRKQLADDNLRLARDLSQWKQHIHTQWQKLRIESVECDGSDEVASGSRLSASTRVFLGDVSLADVAVDAYFGVLDSRGNIVGGELVPFSHAEELGSGMHRFQGVLECRFSGRHGFLIRIMPQHPELGPIYEPGFLRWG